MRKLLNGLSNKSLLVVLLMSLMIGILSAQGGEVVAPPRFVKASDMVDHVYLTWEAQTVMCNLTKSIEMEIL
ncbi:MAG: hypothetical protein FWG98_03840 [Candidatus Cloacimonetes bacterium]|nr:hypothetical protein [Candidatus Cloacimonadota bacterium]